MLSSQFKNGENIFYIDITNRDTRFVEGISDFVIFDNKSILIHNYDEKGVLRGAWYLKDNKEIERLTEYYNELIKDSKPFNDMYEGDAEILSSIQGKLEHCGN